MNPSIPTPTNSQAPNTAQTLIGDTSVSIKPKSKKDLAGEYGIHVNTIAAWCKELGFTTKGKRLSISQVVQFYNAHGYPGNYKVELKLS